MTNEIVKCPDISDGNANHAPKDDWKLSVPPTVYLEKIGALWAEDQGLKKPGGRYCLDRLPDGYRLYERARSSGAKHVDKHLWGHPGHKFFDSPNRFWPHFRHLMTTGSNDGCPCTICPSLAPKIRGAPRLKMAKANSKGQSSRFHDEEHMPDVVQTLLAKLRKADEPDEPIEEQLSMDWLAEKDSLPRALENFPKRKSWLPRVGEIVLFVRHLGPGEEICFEDATSEYKLYQVKDGVGFLDHPKWEAGVIGQTPDEAVKLEDVLRETDKAQFIANSGYRVEPLPDANVEEKSLTKQYKYVPLHHIRPFVFWQEYLKGIPDKTRHQSIRNALMVMASVALVNRYRFKGAWPSATVYCRGVYIGSELLCIGDIVRLTPKEGNEVEDILYIESIKLNFSNLDEANMNDAEGRYNYETTISISGKGYTASPMSAWKAPCAKEIEVAFPRVEGYHQWYWSHDPFKRLEVPFTRVLGRCFNAEPMLMWFPADPSSHVTSSPSSVVDSSFSEETVLSLTHGLSGMILARKLSGETDKRISPEKSWFWADSRAEALDIPSLNHVDTSYFDMSRDENKLNEWHRAAKILERVTMIEEADKEPAKAARDTKIGLKHEDTTTNVTTSTRGTSEEDNIIPRVVVAVPELQARRTGSLLRRSYSATSSARDELDDLGHEISTISSFRRGPKSMMQPPARPTPQKHSPATITVRSHGIQTHLPSRPASTSPQTPRSSASKPGPPVQSLQLLSKKAVAAPMATMARPAVGVNGKIGPKRVRSGNGEGVGEGVELNGNGIAKRRKLIIDLEE